MITPAIAHLAAARFDTLRASPDNRSDIPEWDKMFVRQLAERAIYDVLMARLPDGALLFGDVTFSAAHQLAKELAVRNL